MVAQITNLAWLFDAMDRLSDWLTLRQIDRLIDRQTTIFSFETVLLLIHILE